MGKHLVAVVALDTQLDDVVRALQTAGVKDIHFIIRTEASEFPEMKGFALQPAVMTVMQMLEGDTAVTIDGFGKLLVSGGADTPDVEAFVKELLHDGQTGHGSSLRRQLKDGHAVLAIGSDSDKARDILAKHKALNVY